MRGLGTCCRNVEKTGEKGDAGAGILGESV